MKRVEKRFEKQMVITIYKWRSQWNNSIALVSAKLEVEMFFYGRSKDRIS